MTYAIFFFFFFFKNPVFSTQEGQAWNHQVLRKTNRIQKHPPHYLNILYYLTLGPLAYFMRLKRRTLIMGT